MKHFRQGLALFAILMIVEVPLAEASGSGDPLDNLNITFQATAPDAVLDATVTHLRSVFQYYQPAVDSETTLVNPLKVTGGPMTPTLSFTVHKCVAFICQTVDLVANVRLVESALGGCRRHFVVHADLSQSSSLLADLYNELQVDICYNAANGNAALSFDATAIRANTYSSGIVADQVMDMLQLQIPAMSQALDQALTANGGAVTASFMGHQ